MNYSKFSITSVIAIYTITIVLGTSCESSQDVKSNIDILKNERANLMEQVQNLSDSLTSKQNEMAILNNKLEEKESEFEIYKSGRTPKYILKIHLKQSHISLSISKHIKDSMNAIDFELPVDKQFYDSVMVGTNIVDDFRVGSFILKGSIGDWVMTVKDKEIR